MFNRVSTSLFILCLAGTSSATMWNISSFMDGSQETPPNASPATGTVTGTYDDVGNILSITTMASGFVAPVSAAHIHKAPAGVAGGVIFPLTGATGSTSYFSVNLFTYTAANETDLFAGLHYVNIHSSTFPGGEIRGQLLASPVPEPATLVALCLGGLSMLRKRRR